MAGGTWLGQNKVRPGSYINFKAVPRSTMTVGDRGIVAIGLPLKWGKEGELIEVLSTSLLDGSSKKLIGFDAFNEDSKLLAGALSYAYKALVYRMDRGGSKATATIGNLTVTAKYNGTFGNSILVTVKALENGLFEVITYLNGEVADNQKISTISELEGNDFVDFSGEGEFEENSGTLLSNGTDGTVTESTAYPLMFKALKMAHWQTFACNSSDITIKSNVCDFINQLRDNEGKYVQGVVADYDGADYDGIINSITGCVIDGVEYSKEEFTSIVAGMTAGANFNQSNTAKKINGATKIIGEFDNSEIEKALKNGKFLLSTSAKGEIKVEQDINSLHTFTKEKDYNFSKNRVRRTLDEIGTSTQLIWLDSYMGKVDNTDTGRDVFKGDLISYGNELQRLGGIQEFLGTDDISINQGMNLDSVLVDWYVKPVDSMEKLYMNVKVRG